MSEPAIEFVEEWVSERINAQDYPPGGDNSRAEALASACLAAAKAEGISQADMDDAFEDLTAFIAGEIEEANNREVARLAAKDD